MNPQQIEELIRAGLPGAVISVRSEDNVHFEATVVSTQFIGARPLQRHQLVYKALGEHMGGEIHALALQTLTPDEQAASSSNRS
ncbi:MAG: BolA/IbaG family iron-sulfur metabolism protein [Steroidobacteraceae bacterium]